MKRKADTFSELNLPQQKKIKISAKEQLYTLIQQHGTQIQQFHLETVFNDEQAISEVLIHKLLGYLSENLSLSTILPGSDGNLQKDELAVQLTVANMQAILSLLFTWHRSFIYTSSSPTIMQLFTYIDYFTAQGVMPSLDEQYFSCLLATYVNQMNQSNPIEPIIEFPALLKILKNLLINKILRSLDAVHINKGITIFVDRLPHASQNTLITEIFTNLQELILSSLEIENNWFLGEINIEDLETLLIILCKNNLEVSLLINALNQFSSLFNAKANNSYFSRDFIRFFLKYLAKIPNAITCCLITNVFLGLLENQSYCNPVITLEISWVQEIINRIIMPCTKHTPDFLNCLHELIFKLSKFTRNNPRQLPANQLNGIEELIQPLLDTMEIRFYQCICYGIQNLPRSLDAIVLEKLMNFDEFYKFKNKKLMFSTIHHTVRINLLRNSFPSAVFIKNLEQRAGLDNHYLSSDELDFIFRALGICMLNHKLKITPSVDIINLLIAHLNTKVNKPFNQSWYIFPALQHTVNYGKLIGKIHTAHLNTALTNLFAYPAENLTLDILATVILAVGHLARKDSLEETSICGKMLLDKTYHYLLERLTFLNVSKIFTGLSMMVDANVLVEPFNAAQMDLLMQILGNRVIDKVSMAYYKPFKNDFLRHISKLKAWGKIHGPLAVKIFQISLSNWLQYLKVESDKYIIIDIFIYLDYLIKNNFIHNTLFKTRDLETLVSTLNKKYFSVEQFFMISSIIDYLKQHELLDEPWQLDFNFQAMLVEVTQKVQNNVQIDIQNFDNFLDLIFKKSCDHSDNLIHILSVIAAVSQQQYLKNSSEFREKIEFNCLVHLLDYEFMAFGKKTESASHHNMLLLNKLVEVIEWKLDLTLFLKIFDNLCKMASFKLLTFDPQRSSNIGNILERLNIFSLTQHMTGADIMIIMDGLAVLSEAGLLENQAINGKDIEELLVLDKLNFVQKRKYFSKFFLPCAQRIAFIIFKMNF